LKHIQGLLKRWTFGFGFEPKPKLPYYASVFEEIEA